ncbi:MAG: hypothetical protein ACO1SV_22790 [Fimbriimonas sp.]
MFQTLVSATLALTFAPAAPADSPAKQAFIQLKKLEGTWEGKAGHGAEAQDVKVVYKVTGQGSALVETQFPGDPHEMITIYHLDGDNLLLTHYCSAQNQPKMKLIPGKTANVLRFDFVSASNMKPKDPHMHNLTMRLVGADHIVSEWGFYANGKSSNIAKFEMRRVK